MSNKGLVLRQNISNIANTIRKNSTIQTTYKPRQYRLPAGGRHPQLPGRPGSHR